jgi:hypothetical protein
MSHEHGSPRSLTATFAASLAGVALASSLATSPPPSAAGFDVARSGTVAAKGARGCAVRTATATCARSAPRRKLQTHV